MKVVYIYMCHPEFEMGGLGSDPPQKKWGRGFQSGSLLKIEGVFELKITKKRILLKGGSFRAAQVGKVEQTNVYF